MNLSSFYLALGGHHKPKAAFNGSNQICKCTQAMFVVSRSLPVLSSPGGARCGALAVSVRHGWFGGSPCASRACGRCGGCGLNSANGELRWHGANFERHRK